MSRQWKPGLQWTRADLAAVLSLLFVGAIWLGIESSRQRLIFSDHPPAQPDRVSAASELIDPNTASIASLVRLRSIGPTLAGAIVEYRNRDESSPFRTASDLAEIRGIGPATVRNIAGELSLPE